jgi:hypothetical protein
MISLYLSFFAGFHHFVFMFAPAASFLPPWGDAAKGSDGDPHPVNLVGAGSCRSGVREEGLQVRIAGVLRQRPPLIDIRYSLVRSLDVVIRG